MPFSTDSAENDFSASTRDERSFSAMSWAWTSVPAQISPASAEWRTHRMEPSAGERGKPGEGETNPGSLRWLRLRHQRILRARADPRDRAGRGGGAASVRGGRAGLRLV